MQSCELTHVKTPLGTKSSIDVLTTRSGRDLEEWHREDGVSDKREGTGEKMKREKKWREADY